MTTPPQALVNFLRNRDALALRIERLGKAHPDLGESWGNLAELLFDAGRFAEAERAYRETLAIYRATLPRRVGGATAVPGFWWA